MSAMALAPEPSPSGEDARVREHASNLRSLLVLSTLMTEGSTEEQIVHLMATSVCSFGPCRVEGIYLEESGWCRAKDLTPASRALLERQFQRLPVGSGRVDLPGANHAFVFPLLSLGGRYGYIVVSSRDGLTKHEAFLLGTLAQQAGVALANARLLNDLRITSKELADTNSTLARTVSELQRSLEIHERLTQAAALGLGREGLAQTVHELTNFPVAIEDRWGNLRAYAGGEPPDPYPKSAPHLREQLLRRFHQENRPFRDRDRLLGIAAPRADVVGVIALIDPKQQAGTFEVIALEHATTVLAMELARLHSLAEAELRLRRDLVEELLSGTDRDSALARAQALGHDLEQPHRVVLVHGHSRSRDEDQFLHAIRTAARNLDMGSLIVARSGTVVILSEGEPKWGELRDALLRELPGGRCRIAVGGVCSDPGEFPRSYREARLALNLQETTDAEVTCFDDLGVYRIFAAASDVSAIQCFIEDQLGPLLRYDAKKGGDLVQTLHQYLECGGNYEATAQALIVHRSTLKYRLQRIRAITEQDLNDPNSRFNLHLATRAWQTLQGLERAGAS